MGFLKASLSRICSLFSCSFFPQIPVSTSFFIPSHCPMLKIKLQASLSVAQDSFLSTSSVLHNKTENPWKPICLYYTQGKCTKQAYFKCAYECFDRRRKHEEIGNCVENCSVPVLTAQQKVENEMTKFQRKNDKKKPSFPLSKPMAGSSIMSTAFFKTLSFSSIKTVLVILSVLAIVYLLFILALPTPLPLISPGALSPTTSRHLVISIASSSKSWSQRKPFVRLWYKPDSTRAFAFLDREMPEFDYVDPSVPPILVSGDTSEFPYTFVGGLRSAIRVARVVKEIVDRGESDVRWFVFGDDDTIFFMDNLAKTLARYDHEKWYYIGSNSESYEQNQKYSFDMAFGGGGFAISSSLARVLARVLDSCLMRYPHLYGSDSRIFSCLAELGVSLTHEPGFHQVDMRGNLFGMLSAHPLSPIVSLHHLDAMDPIFPNVTTIQALEHLFEAVDVDSAGVFQHTVCYDRSNSLTISVSWGFSIQVFEGNQLLPDLLSLQTSFNPWRRGISASHFMFNTRDYQKDPCKRPLLFYMEDVAFIKNNVWSNYSRHMVGKCGMPDSMKGVQQIRVVTQKFEFDPKQALRRRCCDVIPSSDEESMLLHVRQCLGDELISMQV